VDIPIKIPPKTRFSQPSKIYPSLALKWAHKKEGIIPKISEIVDSSRINLDLFED